MGHGSGHLREARRHARLTPIRNVSKASRIQSIVTQSLSAASGRLERRSYRKPLRVELSTFDGRVDHQFVGVMINGLPSPPSNLNRLENLLLSRGDEEPDG